MSDNYAIRLTNVGKMYKLYRDRNESFLDAIGLYKYLPGKRRNVDEFWALRNIDLEIKKGERLGIIGRNGAGKSTLLKLLTGNLSPTEGEVNVNGAVQALLTSGAGFYPEFTGYENIRSSLIYQGLTSDQIEKAIKEIAQFTELGEFLNQPFKVYSAGMQSRLTFSTATTLNPDILIVDEILGAGDAYFFGKSIERMKELVLGGATVLIVSHALDQISRFCERAIWVDRGRIIYHGSALDTIKAYQEYILKLEDRRLQAKNRKRQSGIYAEGQLETYSDSLTVIFRPETHETDNFIDIFKIELYEGDILFESLLVGDVQDTSPSMPIFTVLSQFSKWSTPLKDGARYYRRIIKDVGQIACYAYAFDEASTHQLNVFYRSNCDVSIEIYKNSELMSKSTIASSDNNWTNEKIGLSDFVEVKKVSSPTEPHMFSKDSQKNKIRRWPGSNKISIQSVQLLNQSWEEQNIYQSGESIIFRVLIQANETDSFTIRPVITIYRLDGVAITNQADDKITSVFLEKGEQRAFDLKFNEINLGSGDYVLSVALFSDEAVAEQRYDLTDRSHEFKIINTDKYDENSIFHHSGYWELKNTGVLLSKSEKNDIH